MKRALNTLLLVSITVLNSYAQRTWLDYQQVLYPHVWLLTSNSAALSTYQPADSTQRLIANASVSMNTQQGHFAALNDSPHQWQALVKAQSVFRLNPQVVMRGDMAYINQWGTQAGGSVWINPEQMPFDIIEYDDSTRGNVRMEKYHINGELALEPWRNLSLGAKFAYSAATSTKQKDPRHTNSLMRIDASLGAFYRFKELSLGANYLLQRNTESVQFRTYGRTDRTYHYLIDFGAMMGRDEMTDGKGYTSADNEKPLVDMRHGIALQAGYNHNSLTIAGEWQWLHRHGHYGIESPSLIDFNKHHGDLWQIISWLQHATQQQVLRLSFRWQHHNLRDMERTYSIVNSGGVSDVVYFDDRLMGMSEKTTYCIAADAQWGIKRHLAKWAVQARVDHNTRTATAVVYPYFRESDTHLTTLSLSATRNWLVMHDRHISLNLNFSWGTGDGNRATDYTLGTPAQGNKPPATPFDASMRLFQWLTTTRTGASMMLRYAFNVTPAVRLHADAAYGFVVASEPNSLPDAHRHHATLTLGCSF